MLRTRGNGGYLLAGAAQDTEPVPITAFATTTVTRSAPADDVGLPAAVAAKRDALSACALSVDCCSRSS